MRRAAKTDDNQNDIVHVFRVYGWSVQILSAVGQGCTDIVVGKWGLNIMVEIKDGSKPPSARKLTPDQIIWHDEWRGLKCVVESREHVYEIDRKAKTLIEAMKKARLSLNLELGRG